MVGEWWHWGVAGIILVIAELFVPSFVLIWFGLGALSVALVQAFEPYTSIAIQLSLWLTFSTVMTILWFKVFKAHVFKTRVGTSTGNLIGEVGIIIERVAPFEKGRIRFQKPVMGSDNWPCASETPIECGDRAKLIAVEGNYLTVERM